MEPNSAPLTRADLDAAVAAIVAAVRADTAAQFAGVAVQFAGVAAQFAAARTETTAEFAATRTETTAQFAAARADLDAAVVAIRARIEAAERATAGNLTDLRSELIGQLEILQRRIERMDGNQNYLLGIMAGISKSLSVGEQFDSATAGTLAGIKRTIDELVRRIDGLEKRAS
jgi:hypothetical protein